MRFVRLATILILAVGLLAPGALATEQSAVQEKPAKDAKKAPEKAATAPKPGQVDPTHAPKEAVCKPSVNTLEDLFAAGDSRWSLSWRPRPVPATAATPVQWRVVSPAPPAAKTPKVKKTQDED